MSITPRFELPVPIPADRTPTCPISLGIPRRPDAWVDEHRSGAGERHREPEPD